jgi:hypothetical protein
MTDIVTRLHLRDEYEVMLDHLNQPYGLAKSLEHEAADEIERLRKDNADILTTVTEGWDQARKRQDQVRNLEAERDRLRGALQDMLADREAWQIGRDTRDRARAALKETGHE